MAGEKNTSDIIVSVLDSAFRFLKWIAAALLLLFLCSGFKYIYEGEQAAVFRFGKYNYTAKPGILYGWPYPITEVIRVPYEKTFSVTAENLWHPPEEKKKTHRRDPNIPKKIDPLKEGYCITGDNEIVQPKLKVNYHIRDAKKFVFAIQGDTAREKADEAANFIRSMVMSEVTRVIAGIRIDDVLGEKQDAISRRVAQRLQRKLDILDSGIVVEKVQLTSVIPPRHVKEYFDAVSAEKTNIDRSINEAKQEQAQKINAARAKAYQIESEAKSYAQEVVRTAESDTERFRGYLREYTKNSEVVRRRIFLKMFDTIAKEIGGIFFVSPKDNRVIRLVIPGKTEEQ